MAEVNGRTLKAQPRCLQLSLKEYIWMIREKEEESISLSQEISTLVVIRMTRGVGMERCFGLMGQYIKVLGIRDFKRG